MGQEWAASTPFQYFTDLEPDLGRSVTEGRRGSSRLSGVLGSRRDANASRTRRRRARFAAAGCAGTSSATGDHARSLALYRALLALRRQEPALSGSDDAHGDGSCAGRRNDRHAADATDAHVLDRLPLQERRRGGSRRGRGVDGHRHSRDLRPGARHRACRVRRRPGAARRHAGWCRRFGSLSDGPARSSCRSNELTAHRRPRYVPVSTYRLQVHHQFPLSEAAARRPLPGAARRRRLLHVAVLHRGGRQHARLRRLQPQRDQPRARRRGGASQASSRPSRRTGSATSSTSCQSHGHQRRRERVVDRRARERPELADGEVLRHRLGAGQDRAAREAAAADPRRPVRPRPRARRAAARVPRRRAGASLLRARAAGQSAAVPAGLPAGRRAADRRARRRQPAAARVPQHPRVAREPAALHGTGSRADRRTAAREGGRESAAGPAGPGVAGRSAGTSTTPSAASTARPGKPETFDALHELLEAQAYRLAYWRTASHEINYRRFFDVNTLAGLRVEEPDVFEATHALLGQLLGRRQRAGRSRRSSGRPLRSGAATSTMLQELAARVDRRTPSRPTSSRRRSCRAASGCRPAGRSTARPATTSSTT